MRKVRYYESQGVYAVPGIDKFLVGNISSIFSFRAAKHRAIKNNDKVVPPTFQYLLEQSTKSKAADSFDYKAHPTSIVRIGEPGLLVSDPEVL